MSDKVRKPWLARSLPAVARFAARARRATGLSGKVTVLLASNSELRSLNRRFRRTDQPTDVLAFPAATEGHAGDIAISAEIAESQARRYQHSPAHEIKILVLHGMLHLAGYDHASDGGAMARKEEALRIQLGLSPGLIARTEKRRGRLHGSAHKNRRRA